ncbi:MAG: antirestriction protein [Desulfamplus sp.]|nr:antirestriction protein [Desulfamplus sp.]
METNNKVKVVLDQILQAFESGQIPEAIKIATFPMIDVPCSHWSFNNRLILFLSGSADARGFNQWKEIHRSVNKGAKAIYILVPCFKKKVDEDTGDEEKYLTFFKTAPVFRVEDTDGEPLSYDEIELPDLPFMERAKEWGINVKAVAGNTKYYGYYNSTRKEIGLASPDESVMLHELAHASHQRVIGSLRDREKSLKEIVAELSSISLCKIAGKTAYATLGNSYQYIAHYASKLKMHPHKACLKVLSEVEQVINLIIYNDVNGASTIQPKQAQAA